MQGYPINKQKIFNIMSLSSKFIFYALIATLLLPFSKILSETTTTEKIQNEGDEAAKSLKKNSRKVKKKIRDATGNHSFTEDIKDSGKNLGDDVKTKAKKAKRKID